MAAATKAQNAARAFLDRLKSTRDGYDEERVWHKFLLDAYSGGGGFTGKVKPTDSDCVGWGADAYGGSCSTVGTGTTTATTTTWGCSTTPLLKYETYLDPFPREDAAKFTRRRDVAHYVNYTQPIADLFSGYLGSVRPTREGADEKTAPRLAQWAQDCNGQGMSWDELCETVVVPRAVRLGWCPVMFDADAAPADIAVTSRAQEQQLGLKVRAIPLFPINLLKWETDDSGSLLWVKVQLNYCEQPDPLGEEIYWSKFIVWKRDTVSAYRVDEGSSAAPVALFEDVPHKFGAVPIVVFRANAAPDDPVRGTSMVGSVAVENRRHFNLVSELDEHLRGTVFALLQVPIPPGAEPPPDGQLVGGNGSAVPIPSDSSQSYQFIAPPQSVADTYERRIEASVREMYRIVQAPFDQDAGVASSGIAHAYKFESTNKRLVRVGKGFAHADQTALQLVGRALGMDNIKAIRTSAPQGYLVDDISVDLDNLLKAVGLKGMSATAKMLAIGRAVQKMLPNMLSKDRALINDELMELRDADLESAAPSDKGTVGPQTDAVVKLVEQVVTGQMPRETAVNTLVTVFGLTQDDASNLLGTVGNGFVPEPKVMPFGGGGGPPPFAPKPKEDEPAKEEPAPDEEREAA